MVLAGDYLFAMISLDHSLIWWRLDEKCDNATKKVHNMVIKRDRYLKQIIAKKKDGMIKIVSPML